MRLGHNNGDKWSDDITMTMTKMDGATGMGTAMAEATANSNGQHNGVGDGRQDGNAAATMAMDGTMAMQWQQW